MSEPTDPPRLTTLGSGAPPDLVALVRAIEPPTALPPALYRDVRGRLARRPSPSTRPLWRRARPALVVAAAMVAGLVVWQIVARSSQAPRAAIAPEPTLEELHPEEPSGADAEEPAIMAPIAPTPAPTAPSPSPDPTPWDTAAEVGFLTVNAMPPARIFIDGEDSGFRTPLRRLPLPPGRHVIELRVPRRPASRQTVTIRSGGVTRVAPERVPRRLERPTPPPADPF